MSTQKTSTGTGTMDGCYMDATLAHKDGKISSTEFFRCILRHFGPLETRVRHTDDNLSLDDFINPLFWKGYRDFGAVAAAIKICEGDPLAASVNVELLELLFLECVSMNGTLDNIRERDVSYGTLVFGSPLFRQAFFVTALSSGNAKLAVELISLGQLAPPPSSHCIFRIWCSSWNDDPQVAASMYAAAIKAGWADPSERMVTFAVESSDPDGGVALLSALRDAGHDKWTKSKEKEKSLTRSAFSYGGPSMVRYLWDVYSINIPFESDMLIRAIEDRDMNFIYGKGNKETNSGTEMLSWLLDQGLDINCLRMPDHPDPDLRGWTDPRAKAEEQWAYEQRPWSEKKTALHAAAWNGNVEAVRFLLERGADPRIKNGLGQTADKVARSGGYISERHIEAATMIENRLRGSKV